MIYNIKSNFGLVLEHKYPIDYPDSNGAAHSVSLMTSTMCHWPSLLSPYIWNDYTHQIYNQQTKSGIKSTELYVTYFHGMSAIQKHL